MKYGGIGLVMLAAILWGITGGIAEILMNKGWNPTVISFYRGAIGLICIFSWFLFRAKQNWPSSSSVYVWSTLAGVGLAGNFTFYFLSIEASSIAIAATLMYTAPVFVLLISFLLRLERSTWLKWGCIVVILLGTFLLTGVYKSGSSSVNLLGAATGLGSGFSYALFIFSFKNASTFGKPQSILTIAFFAFSLILLLFIDHHEALSVITSGDVGWFLLLGLVGAGVSFVFYIVGIKWTTPSTASMIAMIEPVTASLFGVLVLKDSLTIVQLVGMLIILATITILSVRQSN
ncbi:EamA-like transporter family protein [Virgibacillus subterraneus]|uniref:EamA-like transporter family protein n=1 Tax=Virgibacillus subterraneus TaxID=621109 RepID=A0A1H9GC88_9BACI|nr:DMT family transporter [Virgibacillus subterraneus]SEQ47677.1 EamA-like transporter family protein [Virgibacillus subterraneus]